MSLWDNVKKFAQPYSDDDYDDYDEDDDYDDAFSAYEGRAAMRQSAPKENKKRGRPRKEK